METNGDKDEYFILFFTDGCDTISGDNIYGETEVFKNFLKTQSNKRNIESTIYTIGFSAHHDAKLLNTIAKAGTTLGNFIYIDNREPNSKDKLIDSVHNSIDLALNQSSSTKIHFTNSTLNMTI